MPMPELNFDEIVEENHLVNFENYGVYGELVKTGSVHIFTGDINNSNLDDHFMYIMNLMRDGIETDTLQRGIIDIEFVDGERIKLSVFRYFYNLIFWKLPLSCGDELTSEFLFFPKDLSSGAIKNYIDEKFIEKHQTGLNNSLLNNLIDDCLYKFKYIDEFSLYLLNTINNEDTIDLMNQNQEFWDYMHADLSGVPIEDIKNVGMDIEHKAVSIMKKSNHCLRDALRTGQGINLRQHKEFAINIGTKPDGNGGVYNHSINSSFSNGGLQSEADLKVDSGASRYAQIMSKENVGDSGYLSRTIGLNNQTSRLHVDSDYVCNTQNLLKVTIKNEKWLDKFKNRCFRFSPTGIEYYISSSPLRDNKDLIGKTLYFRSPITCSSHARGQGVCHKCYGRLANVNYDLSVGKIAAEILCSILTQILLSSKHLLESMIIALKWNKEFYELFDPQANIISIKESLSDIDMYQLRISNISYDDEHDQFEYNAHVTEFEVIYPDGSTCSFHTNNNDNIYLANGLLDIINNLPENEDDIYTIPFTDIKDSGVFMVKLMNAEISRTLDRLISMIRTSGGMAGKTKEQAVEEIIDTIIEGKINVDAVHVEVLLANQCRSADDILEMPNWDIPDEPYQLLGLNKALTDHPSVTISLEFEKLSKALYYPLNYKKRKANAMDLFFMTQPQDLMSVEDLDPNKPKTLFTHIKPRSEVEKYES